MERNAYGHYIRFVFIDLVIVNEQFQPENLKGREGLGVDLHVNNI